MTDFNEKLLTIRANTQALEIIRQSSVLKTIYAEMEEVWLSLYTQDKKCPIVEQTATIVKRKLIRQYSIKLITYLRSIVNTDLVTMAIDPDESFWIADDIVQRLSDGVIRDHFHLFCLLVNALFGLSMRYIDVMFKETITLNDLTTLLNDVYIITVDEGGVTDETLVQVITERLEAYIAGEDTPVFDVTTF